MSNDRAPMTTLGLALVKAKGIHCIQSSVPRVLLGPLAWALASQTLHYLVIMIMHCMHAMIVCYTDSVVIHDTHCSSSCVVVVLDRVLNSFWTNYGYLHTLVTRTCCHPSAMVIKGHIMYQIFVVYWNTSWDKHFSKRKRTKSGTPSTTLNDTMQRQNLLRHQTT
jgi:hypothetical protein